ncbi:hypothetical protein PYW07_014488 [Mythimna separata]|uniref:Integrase catalytic domain-containing protein n=1 Tax=Mythimna separata TaxID=271217 RepID=A0AAD7YYF6_MYTSE|nr:hypothetical protein PYW07_014488 [Mythimna separata]
MECQVNTNLKLFDKFSTLNRLKRTMAYVLRFITNTRIKQKANRALGALSVNELNNSMFILSQLSQKDSFPEEYERLKNNLPIKANRYLNGLNLFLDKHGLMRVGGRSKNSLDFSFDKKHPVVLSSKHNFTSLLFRHEHNRLLHAGPQLLLSTLRENWWPVGGRNLARKITRKCVICTRIKGKTINAQMGDLPAERLESQFPFYRCGVDYAGPLSILSRRGRGAKLEKCYICLFICFSTKAIHLELVTSLTTEAYILALKRFISRRGKPAEIFSDNGKNFVGAAREFSSFINNNFNSIIDYTANENIKFSFIPPYTPHFGGLWEAGVKSCKHHLRRVVGNAHLTYEEFYTVLALIESILNSRPISPLSSDPTDELPLTPAHFLIGRPLTAAASEDITATPTFRLSRYARVEQLRQQFWQRWTKEYITELQMRTKWKNKNQEIKPNTLVLIKEDNLPPLRWRLGRVTRTFTGNDGISRVADVKTATGQIRRAYTKLCPLLPDGDDSGTCEAT